MYAELTFLGVDVGAESGRLMAGLWNGSQIRLEETHRFVNGAVPVADSLRWDLLHLWNEMRAGLRKAGRTFREVASIGVDTWALDFVLLDQNNEWLGLPYTYRDARTRGLVEEACRRLPRSEIFANSGLQFMEINTLCQLMAAHRDNPSLLERARKLLMIPDWLHWALCGAAVGEFTNASTTQFLHPKTRTWSTALLEKMGLPHHFLPDLVQPGTFLGRLRPEVASDCRLQNLRVLAPATHDTASAVAAVPVEGRLPGTWAYISSGTWSLVGVEMPEAVLSLEAMEANFTNEGGVDGTYRLLKNVMGLWLLQQLRSALQQAGSPLDYADLVERAARATPLASIVDPDDESFLRSTQMVEALQAFCRRTGQPVPQCEGALVRCVLESLALRYRSVLSQAERITGRSIEVIHIVGGGSRNALLNQLTADASQRPVLAGPAEATALGNILVQAMAAGAIATLGELRAVVRTSCSGEIRLFEPQTENLAMWEEAAARLPARTV